MNKLALLSAAALITSLALPGQSLRRGIAAADLVVIAKAVRVIPTKTHMIHRLKVEKVLRGPTGFDASQGVAVLVTKRVSTHSRPVPAKRMLYCLHDHSHAARKLNLPRTAGTYYKMSGYPGSSTVLTVGDPRLQLAEILIASQGGQSSRKTAEKLYKIALRGDGRVRREAAKSLAERPALTACLTDLHLAQLLARAAGETDDIAYKIDLAAICAVRKLPATIPTLVVSVEHVGDESFLRALGRFARFIHQEKAATVLASHVQRAKGTTRSRLILALGATSTEGALEQLLRMKRRGQNATVVDAALRIHGSPRATAAIARKNPKPKADENGRK